MSVLVITSVLIIMFVLLLVIGMPIAISMGFSSLIAIFLAVDMASLMSGGTRFMIQFSERLDQFL